MRRARLPSLLGPVALFYLVAEGASAQGQLDLLGLVVALAAVVVLLVPGFVVRDPALEGARAVHALGLVCALGLCRYVAPTGLSLVLDLTHALCASAASALVVAIALKDRGLSRRHRLTWPLAIGLLAALLGLASLLESPRLLGQPWIAPAYLAHAPGMALAFAALGSIWARVTRPRLLSSPTDVAQDTWVLLGVVPFALASWLVIATRAFGIAMPAPEVALSLALLGLVAGHARALDPEKKLHAARAARALVRGALTLTVTAALIAFLEPWLRSQPVIALVIASLLIAAVTHRALEPGIQRWLAPAEGRWLVAIEHAHARLGHVSRLEEVASVVLGALREATEDPGARPLLFVSEPALELSLDAAGITRTEPRGLPSELSRALATRRGELILRGPLEAQIVRNNRASRFIAMSWVSHCK
jgi:hypothetical protein